MKPGQASRTAVIVCTARALADGRLPGFSDPTSISLLPEEAKVKVERFRSGGKPRGFRETMQYGQLNGRAMIMAARTIAIDEAIGAAPFPQVVILGAGLDGRAWRMPELKDAVIFEVDHPDSQRDKKVKAAPLKQTAKEIRFVAVDFTRDSLDKALQAAGHDPALPTTWIWEGVVMYLTIAQIEASLATIRQRSAKTSRLIICYLQPAFFLPIVSLIVRKVGEPLKSTFSAAAMRRLLAKHDFQVVQDEDLATVGSRISPEVVKAARLANHQRVVTAEFV